MAYCFAKDDASVEEGFRRIAKELFGKAIGQADKLLQADGKADGEETIHQLRKACKKLRGLYRLVRPGFADYAAENAAVRAAARGLSFARDADVMVATFDALVEHVEPMPEGVAVVRRRLVAQCQEMARGRNAVTALAEFRAVMAAARKRARHWRLEQDGFDAFARGLETSFARARKAMRAARKDPSPEMFHEWRKLAKDHWYHSRLLVPIWPGLLTTHVEIAEELGELLGLHHDVCVFRQTVAGDEPDNIGAVELLLGLADRREAEIVAECLAIGTRLLAEEPAALSKRWRAYWKCWRNERLVAALAG